MKRYRVWLALAGLLGLLAVSLSVNVRLYKLVRAYHRELNASRLDPLGLARFVDDVESTAAAPRILFYGDSRAAQWPEPDIDNVTFINHGIGAHTSAQVWQRFDQHVRPLQPAIIILQVGINDLRTIPLFPDEKDKIIANCKANIQAIVAASHKFGATVIVTTIFPVGDISFERRLVWSPDVATAVHEVNSFIHTLAGEDTIIFDTYGLLSDDNGQVKEDYALDALHLNESGYDMLNERLKAILDEQLAADTPQ